MIGKICSALATSLLILCLFSTMAFAQAAVSRMTKEQLKTQLDDPQTVVVDVRSGRDWTSSKQKIKGALRVEMRNLTLAIQTYDKDKTLVFYCS